MTSLANHHSNSLTKLLLIGDAKSGKTGSLISLVKAGYKLRVLDYDNLLDILKYMVMKECPEKAENVEFRTLRDKRKASANGWMLDGSAKAFIDGVKMLDRWAYTDSSGEAIDLGRPADWGPDYILVIDSLSRVCDAAYDWAESLVNEKMDGRAIYGNAQDAVERLLAGLTSENFRTNVIVIAHVQYMDADDGKIKGFPQGVGKKLSPKIPQYFSSVVLYQRKGDQRTLHTTSTPLIDLANPAPFKVEASYPIETGLAKFFAALQDPPNPEKPREPVATPPQPVIAKPELKTEFLKRA